MNTLKLNDGSQIPMIGFGTWQAGNDQKTVDIICHAIQSGYRHIDTAAIYGNEESVGKAIQQCGIAREDLFITSKVWNSERGEEKALAAFEISMEKLQLDYLDLYLIHWPANAQAFPDTWAALNSSTWAALEKLQHSGRVRSIGVSNFMPEHLQALMDSSKITPAVNQIEYHPGYKQAEVVDFCKKHGIAIEAWSPLGCGKLMQDEALIAMGDKYGKSPAQICIRWCLQNGVVTLPKSVTPARITANIDVMDFSISEEDMAQLDAMDECAFSGLEPRSVKF